MFLAILARDVIKINKTEICRFDSNLASIMDIAPLLFQSTFQSRNVQEIGHVFIQIHTCLLQSGCKLARKSADLFFHVCTTVPK